MRINIHFVQTWETLSLASQESDGIDYLCLLAGLVQFTDIPEEFLTNMQSISIYGQDGFIMQ